MTVPETLAAIRAELTRLATPEGRQSALRFFKEPIDSYGVAAPTLRNISRQFAPAIKSFPLPERNALCTQLFKSGKLEEGTLAVYIYTRFARHCSACEFQLFERWIDRYVHNWAHCDTVSTKLLAACLANDPALIARLSPWTSSRNRWKRRAAAVSLIWEAKKGRYLDSIFAIATPLMEDPDEMVQKGAGWLLKETYPANPQPVVCFLLQWKDRTSRLLLRYAAEKMTPKDRAIVLHVA